MISRLRYIDSGPAWAYLVIAIGMLFVILDAQYIYGSWLSDEMIMPFEAKYAEYASKPTEELPWYIRDAIAKNEPIIMVRVLADDLFPDIIGRIALILGTILLRHLPRIGRISLDLALAGLIFELLYLLQRSLFVYGFIQESTTQTFDVIIFFGQVFADTGVIVLLWIPLAKLASLLDYQWMRRFSVATVVLSLLSGAFEIWFFWDWSRPIVLAASAVGALYIVAICSSAWIAARLL